MASRAGSVAVWTILTALAGGAIGFSVGFMFPVLVNPTGNIVPAIVFYAALFSVGGFLVGLIVGPIIGLRRSKQHEMHARGPDQVRGKNE
jgi:hypothetical protein